MAIKIGLDYFGPKMRGMVETVEGLINFHKLQETSLQHPGQQAEHYPTNPETQNPVVPSKVGTHSVLVHCWRGGMRSAGVAWLLDLYGFKVYTLTGGYKAFRTWALQQLAAPHRFNILGGFTGSGKTEVLKELNRQGEITVDLEALAGHKGSAFGNIGLPAQPGQEMFENKLAIALHAAAGLSGHADKPIWLEDESQRIGTVNLPQLLWNNMRNSPVYFLDIPFQERLEHIVAEYGLLDREKVLDAISRLQKRLGGLETKTAIQHLQDNNVQDCFAILLKYYDKYYQKALNNRTNLEGLLCKITCTEIQPASNANQVLSKARSITV